MVATVAETTAILILVRAALNRFISSNTALNHFIENFVQIPAIGESLNEKNIKKKTGI
jgi:hypothetical protein